MSMPQRTVARPAGYMVVTPEFGRPEEYDTRQCVHCGGHWAVSPGSGRVRGFCLKCMGPTCGAQVCEINCVPSEKMIDNMEKSAEVLRRMIG